MRIRRRTSRLHDKDIAAANVLFDLKIKFAVRETFCLRPPRIASKLLANLFGQRAISIAGKDFDAAGSAHAISDR